MKKPLVVLTGPTAVGKTALSINLAKRIGGEIISADSMQVYRMMDVGSAKILPSEMDGVPHHLIDILDPKEEFNISDFKTLANKAMDEIYERNRIPIIVGGTGFYIQAVTKDISFSDAAGDEGIRQKYTEIYEEHGAEMLHEMLRKVDPESAHEIHQNNVKRVIRALEYYEMTGEKISKHNAEQRANEIPYNLAYFVLNAPRELLYQRIDERVDKMMEDGLVDEVKRLQQYGCTRDMVSMQGLGYKEILDYLDDVHDLGEAVRILKRDTRHFAKRQLTWFRREELVTMVNKDQFSYDEDRILAYMVQECIDRGIIEK